MFKSTLITAHFNPCKYKKPVENFYKFRDALSPQARDELLVVELSFDGEFEIEHPKHLRVDTGDVLWQKEPLINLGILYSKTDTVFWVDHDLIFENPYWYEEAKALLGGGSYDVVQCFQSIVYTDADGKKVGQPRIGTAFGKLRGNRLGPPGGAWAAVKKSIKPLYDRMIVGGGDRVFSDAVLCQRPSFSYSLNEALNKDVEEYNASIRVPKRPRVHYCHGSIVHLFHGERADRKYSSRNKILIENNFNPKKDVFNNSDGMLEFTDKNSNLAVEIRKYFQERKENG